MNKQRITQGIMFGLILLPILFLYAGTEEKSAEERGLYNLTHNPYGMFILTDKMLEKIPSVWEKEWQDKLKSNDLDAIRKVAFDRYGFNEANWDNHGGPMQMVVSERGNWVQNCMLCHGGRVPISGNSMIGMPNTELDMQTLFDDLTKLTKYKLPYSIKFGDSRGRTNAFIFSLELIRLRNEDLSRRTDPVPMGDYKDGDLDPIPWWHLKKKTSLYTDGLLKGDFVRPIMQFTMGEPSGEKIRSWENDFKDVLAYLKTIQPPKYPLSIDKSLATDGQKVFEKTCAGCHGTYGATGKYPNKIVPLEVVKTDPIRVQGLTKEFRAYFNKTWFAQNSSHAEEVPTGYVAPPLDGIWATAPYFHNGAVPTIYGVLTEAARPKYFRRIGGAKDYDAKNVGLKFETVTAPASTELAPEARRRIVDTTIQGLSNQGHPFGFKLSEKEKWKVIEYLKTL